MPGERKSLPPEAPLGAGAIGDWINLFSKGRSRPKSSRRRCADLRKRSSSAPGAGSCSITLAIRSGRSARARVPS
jgi:hypothetical protein